MPGVLKSEHLGHPIILSIWNRHPEPLWAANRSSGSLYMDDKTAHLRRAGGHQDFPRFPGHGIVEIPQLYPMGMSGVSAVEI